MATIAAMVFAIAGAMLAPDAVAQLSIKDSKHNLGTTGAATNNYQFSGTDEVCVFCHTPHGADISAVVPIWNRTLPSPATFTTYDILGTSSLDGKVAPVGSVSIACLSCHDGVTALNAVINAPGSGLSGNATWQAGTWTRGASTIQPGITQIGTDLRNDHPIGIQYAGGGYSTATLTGPGVDPDFRPASNALIGSTRVWWVDGGATGAGTREKSDMLLYTRAAGSYSGQTNPEPFVECASCHDPHQANNPTFLRRPNAGSDLCLTCHVK
jgi:predicted CXXCH cytochrome family protein